MPAKPLLWLGSSREDMKRFPPDARRTAGFQLWRVQLGLDPNDWKPLQSVGSGVREVRVHTEVEHRVLYLAKFEEGVYVLHAFEKRTQKTAKREMDVAKSRFSQLLRLRAKRKG